MKKWKFTKARKAASQQNLKRAHARRRAAAAALTPPETSNLKEVDVEGSIPRVEMTEAELVELRLLRSFLRILESFV